jgi:transcriptional regulator with XRE-family HTH domain
MHDDKDTQLRRELGRRIKAAREAARNGRGYKQSDVGDALGRGDRAVSAWETGRAFPDPPSLVWMAQHFGVSVDELLGLKPSTGGGQWREAAEAVAQACGEARLPLRDFIRVIDRAMASDITDEREWRGFINGLIAAFQTRD